MVLGEVTRLSTKTEEVETEDLRSFPPCLYRLLARTSGTYKGLLTPTVRLDDTISWNLLEQ